MYEREEYNKELEGIDRRREQRFLMQNGVVAVPRTPVGMEIGRVTDISMEGLGITCLNEGKWLGNSLETEAEIDVFIIGADPYLARLPVTAVYDCPLPIKNQLGFLPQRRCGLRFGRLSPEQRQALTGLIAEYSVGVETAGGERGDRL